MCLVDTLRQLGNSLPGGVPLMPGFMAAAGSTLSPRWWLTEGGGDCDHGGRCPEGRLRGDFLLQVTRLFRARFQVVGRPDPLRSASVVPGWAVYR